MTTIRPARPGDGEQIARAWISAGEYYAELDPSLFQVPDGAGLARDFEDGIAGLAELAAGAEAVQLVAESGGEVTGWVYARIEHPEPASAGHFVRSGGSPVLAVESLLVARHAWRTGTGRALLRAAEDWGRSLGAVTARLSTWAGSPVSVPFYEDGMGYRRRQIVYIKDLAAAAG